MGPSSNVDQSAIANQSLEKLLHSHRDIDMIDVIISDPPHSSANVRGIRLILVLKGG